MLSTLLLPTTKCHLMVLELETTVVYTPISNQKISNMEKLKLLPKKKINKN